METEKWVESAMGNFKVFHSHSFKMVLLRKEKKEKRKNYKYRVLSTF